MEPSAVLLKAIQANDAPQVAEALERHPELKGKLDGPLPGYSFGGTALLAAVHQRNREMIDALLRAGADINARSDWWAGSFGVLDSASGLEDFLVERGARVDAHAAARLGMLDRLKELVAADPSLVHARGGDGQTPLHFASSVEIAEYLLAQGADIDARDIDHESTPAQWMASERQEVARYLVKRGCATDLLMASALGDLDLVQRHLDADPASIRMSVSDEWFPKRDPRSGGPIYIWVLGSNHTAHQVARKFRHEEIFRFLMERTPKTLKLALACELGDEALHREILESSPGLAGELADGDRQRLIAAAQGNNTNAVRLMLEAGWPVETQGPGGVSALHWAAFHGNASMAREILRHSPPLELEDSEHHGTPMGWALYGSLHGWHRQTGDYAGVVNALLDAGARPPKESDIASEAVLAALRARGGSRSRPF
jgi:ankyrin repeat protein